MDTLRGELKAAEKREREEVSRVVGAAVSTLTKWVRQGICSAVKCSAVHTELRITSRAIWFWSVCHLLCACCGHDMDGTLGGCCAWWGWSRSVWCHVIHLACRWVRHGVAQHVDRASPSNHPSIHLSSCCIQSSHPLLTSVNPFPTPQGAGHEAE